MFGDITTMIQKGKWDKAARKVAHGDAALRLAAAKACSCSDCDECYNIVYNSAPLYLGTQKVKIQKLSPKRLRIRFGAERKEEVKKVLEQAIDAFGEKPQFDYTQEHFKRGVL